MRRTASFLVIAVASFALPACEKDDEGSPSAASIVFRSDSGFTYMNDTVGMQDTLLVGVLLARGTDPLLTLLVEVSYNGGAAVRKDSVHIDTNPFEKDVTVVTNTQAGSEKWTFSALEPDGDITRRSLTFTVQ